MSRLTDKGAPVRRLLQDAARFQQSGRFEEALACYVQATRLDKRQPEVWHAMAVLNAKAGNYSEAARLVKKALKLKASSEFLITSARIETELGRLGTALKLLHRVTKLAPDSAPAWLALARVFSKQSERSEAIRAYSRATTLAPENPEIRTAYSRFLLAQSMFEDLQALLADWPEDMVYPYQIAGLAAYQQGRTHQAVDLLQKAIAQAPFDALLQNNLGLALAAVGNSRGALDAFRNATRFQVGFVEAELNMANIYQSSGQLEKAKALFARLVREHEDPAAATLGLATTADLMGESREAISLLSAVAQAHPENIRVATVLARAYRHNKSSERALEVLELQNLAPNETADSARQYWFEYGAASDNLGHYERAARCFSEGNALAASRYLADDIGARTDSVLSASLPEGISDFGGIRPVFIVGLPRSGTSLCEQIVAGSKSVLAAGERTEFSGFFDRDASVFGAAPDSAHVEQARANYLAEIDQGFQLMTDKMPLNFWHLGLIRACFPDALIVHCVRDLRDTAVSIYTTNFSDPALAFSNDPEAIVHYINQYQKVMLHWKQAMGDTIFELSYEKLVQDPHAVIPALLRHLGLEAVESNFRFYENKRVVHTASHAQVREPLHGGSIGRYQHYETYLPQFKSLSTPD